MPRLSNLIACLIFGLPALAQADTFQMEVSGMDRSVVVALSAADDGYAVREAEADYFDIRTGAAAFRIAGRFEDDDASANLALVRNNTFVQFDHPDAGRVSCRPDEDDTANTWNRSIVADTEMLGTMYFQLTSCQDELGSEVELANLPFTVQVSYFLMLE